MSTIIEQADSFRRYVELQSQNAEADLTLDELFQRWKTLPDSDQELQESLEAFDRGVADADAGRLVDPQSAIAAARKRLQQLQ